MTDMDEYKHIPIPVELTQEVEKIMGLLGYKSIAEFVKEATRLHLEKKHWEYERKKAEEEERIVEKHEKGEESVEHQWEK